MTVVFVLIMLAYQGGINSDLSFSTLQQCQTVADQVKRYVDKAICVEKQIKKRKMHCTIENRTDRLITDVSRRIIK
jgi:hypothetical protein